MGAAVRLRVLGLFRVEDDRGCEIDIRGRKARGLLAYLAIRGGQQSRDRLADLLWGAMGETRARANLRQCVMTLRTSLGDREGTVLVSEDDAIGLVASRVEVDAQRFLALAASGELAAWQEAADLYGGELLGDVRMGEEPFDDWVEAERLRFTRAACDVLSRLVRARRAAGEHAQAEEQLERWLTIDPSCEEAHRSLIELYDQTGRRWKALEQFERCKGALQRAFGVGPDPATSRAYDRLCSEHGPAAAPAAPAAAARLELPWRPRVAVVPFDCPGPDDTYLGAGMSDDVLIGLSRFQWLAVTAHGTPFAPRELPVDGEPPSQGYTLRGSVRRTGSRVRVSVVLSDSLRGATTWAERYERGAEDVYGELDEIARTITASVARRVEADLLARMRRVPVPELSAHALLLKAKAHHERCTPEHNAAARECLARAIAAEAHLGVAHAWMASCLVQLGDVLADRDALRRADEHLQRALELADDAGECHRVVAGVYLVKRRFERAEHHQRRALELNPNDDKALCQMGEVLAFLGRPADGVPWIEQAMRLNPYHGDGFHRAHGVALYGAGRIEEALAAFQRIRAARLEDHAFAAAVAARGGDGECAAAQLAEVHRRRPEFEAAGFVASRPYREPAAAERLLADLRKAEALTSGPISIAR